MVTHVSWKPIALVTPLQAAIAVTQLGYFIHQLTSHLPIHQVLQFFTLAREARSSSVISSMKHKRICHEGFQGCPCIVQLLLLLLAILMEPVVLVQPVLKLHNVVVLLLLGILLPSKAILPHAVSIQTLHTLTSSLV